MKSKLSVALIITGTMLVLAALFLCLYNIIQDKQSGEKSQQILIDLKKEIIPQATQSENNILFDPMELSDENQTKTTSPSTKEIEGITYLGYLDIPDIGLELPVMENWSYTQLEYSPCCYSGTAADNNLIIAAHNYSSHFRHINSLYSGSIFYFIDADGVVNEYEVTNIELINGNDPISMITDPDDSWDITLFTCNFDGSERIAVRGIRTNRT